MAAPCSVCSVVMTEVCAGLWWLQCTLRSSVTPYIMHGRMFPFKGLIYLFSPKSVFYLKKKKKRMIEKCKAALYIHAANCKFSQSNKYCVPAANEVWMCIR